MTRYEIPVKVHYSGFSSYADLASVLDELRESFWTVEAAITTPDFSGRGGAIYVPLDLVFDVARFVGEAAVAGIVGTLATDGGKKLRDAIETFRRKDFEAYPNPHKRPFGLHVGSLWIVYREPLSDEEFVVSLMAAEKLARVLDNLESGDFIGQFLWDTASQSWKGPFRP